MKEKTITLETIYRGHILDLELQEVELHTGRPAAREIVRHAPAVCVLAEMVDGRFAFVRQFRKPLDRLVIEAVAGVCEPGEDITVSARRELREEIGYEAEVLTRLGAVYPSPGYVDERIDLFHARLADEPVGVDPDEDEHVEMLLMTPAEVWALIDDETIQDAKTVAVWMHWCRRRPELFRTVGGPL